MINLQENGYIGNTNALKYKTEKDLQKGIDKYFQECNEKNLPYTMSGLAESLDIDRRTLTNYSNNDLFFPLIKKAKQKVERQLEENALMGKANSTFTIFNLKNNYGWKDVVETKQENGINNQITNIAKLLNNPQPNRSEKDVQ